MLKSLLQTRSWIDKPVRWQAVIADIILVALVIGPIASPFLASLGIFPFALIAHIIYFMGNLVCPQPEMSLMLMPPHSMAVCMRCYGVLLALVTTRLLYSRDRGVGFYWLNQYRFRGAAIASILTFAYLIEMVAQSLGWWGYNNYVVTVFGYITGLGIGLFIVPVLYRQALVLK